jgi:MOSC domain-containing protein YiiM
VYGDRWFRWWFLWPLRWLKAWREEGIKAKAVQRFRRPVKVGVTSITILSLEDLEVANRSMPEPMTPLEMRRNVVVSGRVDLNSLIGQVFTIGNVRLKGDNLCTPCALPPKHKGCEDQIVAFNKAFGHPKMGGINRGGLRAQVLGGGTIKKGDLLQWKRSSK